jgi:dual specificity tyrosine-phosphorylation-regulated kinase 1
VVCAYDRQQQCDVAIKIIKSKHAFMVQAKTEIRLLQLTLEKDFNDEHNIVRLLDTFVYRKHQCLVFEMLSYNLYELLKNTKYVSPCSLFMHCLIVDVLCG